MSVISLQTREILEFDRLLDQIASYAVTVDGAAHVRNLDPVTDRDEINRRFDCLSEMVTICGGDHNYRPPDFPVLAGPLARLTAPGVVLEGVEIVALGRMLDAALSVRSYILRREDSLPSLSALAGRLEPLEDTMREIGRTFDENNEVRSSASPLLGKLRADARHVRERIEKQLGQIAERLAVEGSRGENFLTLRQERYVLAVRRDEMHSCPGIIQGESGSGNTLFIEPEQVVYSNNRLREIEMDIRREIVRILAGLSTRLAADRPALVDNVRILSELDSLYARALYAREYDCERPGTAKGREVSLRGARHPLLMERMTREGGTANRIVPLDLELTGEERTLLVSGPNAGGKTVLLKTAGIVVLMAQSGIFPPSGPGTGLPVFENVFAAIGDEQSIERDLSTFSSHVLDLVTAVDECGPGSLILLDEVGVGTDPAEGAALAAGVLEHLTRKGCLTLSTTHYGELKLLHERIPGLVNGSLEFDPENMRPTFRFRKGLPGQSYGIEIARNMGLSPLVLERASRYLTGGALNINEYLARLERQQKDLEEQTREAQRLRLSLENENAAVVREREEIRSRLAELERREKAFGKELLRREREHLLQSRRQVEDVIVRLEVEYRAGREEEAARAARRALEDRIAELGRESAAEVETGRGSVDAPDPGRTFSPGDPVRVAGLGLEGEVVDGPDGSGRYTVIAGRARMSLPVAELVPSSRGKAGRRRTYEAAGFAIERPETAAAPVDRLDLRGMRADEIDHDLERFLGQAVADGFGSVVIVHGKGAGVLRERVSELLSRDRRVRSFRLGAWNEGGSGATVVTLAGA